MRATRLIPALSLVLTLAFAGCQSGSLTGPVDDALQSASGPLAPTGGECDPNLLPC